MDMLSLLEITKACTSRSRVYTDLFYNFFVQACADGHLHLLQSTQHMEKTLRQSSELSFASHLLDGFINAAKHNHVLVLIWIEKALPRVKHTTLMLQQSNVDYMYRRATDEAAKHNSMEAFLYLWNQRRECDCALTYLCRHNQTQVLERLDAEDPVAAGLFDRKDLYYTAIKFCHMELAKKFRCHGKCEIPKRFASDALAFSALRDDTQHAKEVLQALSDFGTEVQFVEAVRSASVLGNTEVLAFLLQQCRERSVCLHAEWLAFRHYMPLRSRLEWMHQKVLSDANVARDRELWRARSVLIRVARRRLRAFLCNHILHFLYLPDSRLVRCAQRRFEAGAS